MFIFGAGSGHFSTIRWRGKLPANSAANAKRQLLVTASVKFPMGNLSKTIHNSLTGLLTRKKKLDMLSSWAVGAFKETDSLLK